MTTKSKSQKRRLRRKNKQKEKANNMNFEVLDDDNCNDNQITFETVISLEQSTLSCSVNFGDQGNGEEDDDDDDDIVFVNLKQDENDDDDDDHNNNNEGGGGSDGKHDGKDNVEVCNGNIILQQQEFLDPSQLGRTSTPFIILSTVQSLLAFPAKDPVQ